MTQRLVAGGGRVSAAPTYSPTAQLTTGVRGNPVGMSLQYMTSPSNVAANPTIARNLAGVGGFGGLDEGFSVGDFSGGGDVAPNTPNAPGALSAQQASQIGQVAGVLGAITGNPVLGVAGSMFGLGGRAGAQTTPQGVVGQFAAPAIGMAIPGPIGQAVGQTVSGFSQGKSAGQVGRAVGFNAALSAINPLAPMAYSVLSSIAPSVNTAVQRAMDSVLGVPTQAPAPVESRSFTTPALGSFTSSGGGSSSSGAGFGFGGVNAADTGNLGFGGGSLGGTAVSGGGRAPSSGRGRAPSSGSGGSSSSSSSGGFGFGGVDAASTGNLGFGGGSLGGTATSGGGSSSGGGGKIVCTAMNDAYGFGSFRQAIWLRHSKNLDPAYEKGYHKLFLPLVRKAYKESHWYSSKLRTILEDIARCRTADIRAESRGKKRHVRGRVYRFFLEPLCFIVGKFVLLGA
jgi:hypothetical protein